MKQFLADIILYLRACYRADQRETLIENIFDKKIEQQIFTSGSEDILSGESPRRPLEKDLAQEYLKTLQVYQKEKVLRYFAFFICGKPSQKHPRFLSLCAPLIECPAEIQQEETGEYFLQLDFKRLMLNYPILSYLDDWDAMRIEEGLQNVLPQKALDYPGLQELIKALKPFLPQINFKQVYRYPEELCSPEDLQKRRKQKGLELLPASCLAISSLSKNVRGVLNELQQMAEPHTSYSPPLMALFGQEPDSPKPAGHAELPVPANLSPSQYAILQSVHTNSLSMVSGPPGTGKTFTAAALALDQIKRNKTVLLASRNDTALDAFQDILENSYQMDELIIRAGHSGHQKRLKKKLEAFIKGEGIAPIQQKKHLQEDHKTLKSKRLRLARNLKASIDRFQETLLYHLKRNTFFRASPLRPTGWYTFWKRFRFDYFIWVLNKKPILSAAIRDFYKTYQKILVNLWDSIRLEIQLERQAQREGYSRDFEQFLYAIRARRDAVQSERMKEADLGVILKAFPIWLINQSDIYDVLPLQTALFDLVIMDETSQCDIPSSLPILQRGKKAVLLGDPQQLRHISFLSKARQKVLYEGRKLPPSSYEFLNYRDKSILDLGQEANVNPQAIHTLNEHFRSPKEIIAFSNAYFYQNSLHLMKISWDRDRDTSLQKVFVSASRDKQGHNPEEAEALLKTLDQLINKQKDIPGTHCDSIGVLSPFRDQIDYLSELIQNRCHWKSIEKHRLMVGTAHSFQGSERDVMFISWVLDPESPAGAYTHINRPDVFNVSITRARERQLVFHSFITKQLKEKSLLRAYMESIPGARPHTHTPSSSQSLPSSHPFFHEVWQFLEPHCQALLAHVNHLDLSMDMLGQCGAKRIGVLLLGPEEATYHLPHADKILQLLRAGIYLVPISFLEWQYRKTACKKALCILLDIT